jgi:hypothetical protein
MMTAVETLRSSARRPVALLAALLLAALPAACDDDGPSDGRDAGRMDGATADGATGDGAAVSDAAADTADAAPDAIAADPGPSADPLPTDGSPHRIFGPEVILNGDGNSTCGITEHPKFGFSPQKWCAFSRPGNGPGVLDLWVIDILQATKGPVPCDGTSTSCRKVMERIWTGMPLGGPSHPFAHAFDGRTLTIYADAPPNDRALHQGPIYVWRSNVQAPFRVTSDRGLLCHGGDSMYCLDDVVGNPMNPDSVELRAGAVMDYDAGLLPSVTHFRPNRADGTSAWHVEVAAFGSFFFSSPDPATDLSVLYWVGGVPPKAIATDVGQWHALGLDIVFLNRLAPGTTGVLSQFWNDGHAPEPTAPKPIVDAVRSVDVIDGVATADRDGASGRGLDLLEGTARAPRRLFDFQQPPELVHFATNDSSQITHTVWISFDFVGEIIRNADLTRCTLATTPLSEVFNAGFVGSDLVYWSESAGVDQERSDGYIAPRDACRTATRFATGLHNVLLANAQGIIFTEAFDDATATVTVKFARAVAAAGVVPAHLEAPVVIAEKVDQYVTVVHDNANSSPYVLFRATAVSSPLRPGIYLYKPQGL